MDATGPSGLQQRRLQSTGPQPDGPQCGTSESSSTFLWTHLLVSESSSLIYVFYIGLHSTCFCRPSENSDCLHCMHNGPLLFLMLFWLPSIPKSHFLNYLDPSYLSLCPIIRLDAQTSSPLSFKDSKVRD